MDGAHGPYGGTNAMKEGEEIAIPLKLRIAHVTSIHPDFDARIWKGAVSAEKSGCEVRVVCPWSVTSGTVKQGDTLHTFRRVQRRLLRPVLIPVRLFRALRQILPLVDIVHFHDVDILPYMALLSLFKPVVYDVHENYPEEMLVRDWIPPCLRWLLCHVVRHVENVLARVIHNLVIVAPSQEDRFSRIGLRPLMMANYASISLLEGATPDNYLERPHCIVFSGSNYESNGSLLLLDIASRLKRIRPELRLLMVDRFASPAFRTTFMDERTQRGLTSYVELVENVPPHELTSILNRGTVAIAPNLRVPKQIMAMPNKLFEYMAASLPIVSSDLVLPSRLFKNEKLGLLAKPEDASSFVQQIVRLTDDRYFAQSLGRAACSAFIERFTWEGQTPALLAFYEELLRTRRRAG